MQLPFLETREALAFLASYSLLWDGQTLPLPQHTVAHKGKGEPGETTGAGSSAEYIPRQQCNQNRNVNYFVLHCIVYDRIMHYIQLLY